MFDFIKNLFTKKEPEKGTVQLGNLNEWFNTKSNIVSKNLNENINLIKTGINSEIEKTKSNLERLKEAKLQNTNIPLRAKQMMEGNRTSYIKIISNFLDDIKIEEGHEALLNFCNDFDESLNRLGKSTTRSYHVLKEFFEHQATDIAINIKNIERLVKEIRSAIKKSNIDKIEIIKDSIVNLKNKIKQKTTFEEELKNKEAELNKLKQEKEILVKEVENIKNSEDYMNFDKLKQEKEGLIKNINHIEENIFHSFSVIKKASKKYSRMILEDEKLLNNYIENPVKTLLEDKEMGIIKILEGMKRNLLQDKIELDEKKKSKTLTEIEKLNKQLFIDFLNEHAELNEKLKNIKNEIKNSEIKSRYKKANEKLDQADYNLEKTDSNTENLKKEIEKINIDKIKDNLQRDIKEILNIEINIA